MNDLAHNQDGEKPQQNEQLSKLAQLAQIEDGGPSAVDAALEDHKQEEAEERAEEVGYSPKECAAGVVSSIEYGLKQFVGVELDDETRSTAVKVYTPCFEGGAGMAAVGAAGPYLKWVVALGFTGITGFGIYQAVKARQAAEEAARSRSDSSANVPSVPVTQPSQEPIGDFSTSGE